MNYKNKDKSRLPGHVAIIMDGNGRWAQKKGLSRTEGHREGANALRKVVRYARKIGINCLTLFAFSEQNWERPLEEVNTLMELFEEYIDLERDEVLNNGIRLYTIGFINKLPSILQEKLLQLEKDSAKNKDMKLGLAISFGGREEILDAVQKLISDSKKSKKDIENLTVEQFNKYLMSKPFGDVDFLIRTGGEKRMSNFFLWESAYAELYFTETLWPDFNEDSLDEALEDFKHRQRRFGKVS